MNYFDAKPFPESIWDSKNFQDEVSKLYFPVDTKIPNPETFVATYANWKLADINIARLRCSAMAHRRNGQQASSDSEAYFLLSMPQETSVHFRQGSTDLAIRDNKFIIQLSQQPYEYVQEVAGEVWTVRIPLKRMAALIASPEHYASYAFDTEHGIGRIFADLLCSIPSRLHELTPSAQEDLSKMLLELVALTFENDQAVLGSNSKPIRHAMMVRVEKYIRKNLTDPSLDPEKIAVATGMSTRYLHKLFHDADKSVMKWVQDQRLCACDADLRHSAPSETVAEVAYRWGFTNAAHFSRLYKAKFGIPPKDRRKPSPDLHRKSGEAISDHSASLSNCAGLK